MPPRNAADFLELEENCTFLDRKLISALDETADWHKLVTMGVEAPGRQGVKLQEYLDIPSFRTGSRTGWIGVQDVMLFLSGLSTPPYSSLSSILLPRSGSRQGNCVAHIPGFIRYDDSSVVAFGQRNNETGAGQYLYDDCARCRFDPTQPDESLPGANVCIRISQLDPVAAGGLLAHLNGDDMVRIEVGCRRRG